MSKLGIQKEPILVGREKEIEELQSLLNSAVEGKGKTVFISGEAGSGKTRITHGFLDAARKRGVAVMAGWCLSDVATPYFPFVEAFNSYFTSPETEQQLDSVNEPGAALSLSGPIQMIPEERGIAAWLTKTEQALKPGKPGAVSPQVWKDQVFAGVTKTLHAISDHEPIILFIEDLQWADSASLALLHYVARVVNDSEKVLVVATFRSEELTSDVEGYPHPLAETLRKMRREELFTEIKLSSLNEASVSMIAENMIGGSLQHGLAEKLAAESRGNPLFVVESLRMLFERKSLVQENNEWRLAVDELGIPSKIRDIILGRLACLKYAQRRILDAASVIGEEFDVDLLSTVLGQDSLDILETLNVITHSTSLVRVEKNGYRFDHARSRETLYEELALPLKRGYHGRIAEKLESTKKAAPPLSDLAYHYAQAGNKEKAVKYALAAGKDEVSKWSNAQAIKHFQYVLQNVTEVNDKEKRTALEGLGDACTASYMYTEAIKTFDGLASIVTGSEKLRALRKATDAAYAKGDMPDLLIEYAKKAEELRIDDRLEMARIIDNRGHAWAFSKQVGVRRGPEDYKLDLADYQTALKAFEEENSLPDTAEALRRSGLLRMVLENLTGEGLGELLRAVAIFTELGDIRKQVIATLNLGEGLGAVGLFAEERSAYVEILRIGEKLGFFDELALASMYLSGFEEDDGNIAEALSRSLKALDFSMKTEANYIQGTLYAALTRRYTLIGDLKNADKYFEKLKMVQSELYSPDFSLQNGVARGVYFAAKGEWEESNFIFSKFEEYCSGLDENFRKTFVGGEAFFREGYAWALEKQGRFEEAKIQRNKVQTIIEEIKQQVEAKFGRANLQLSVMVPIKVQVGEEFEMRLDLVNIGRRLGKLIKFADAVSPEFKVGRLPSFCSLLPNGDITIKEKGIEPFKVETVKLKLNAAKAGSYILNPELSYRDDMDITRAFKVNPIYITAQPVKPAYEVLPNRITTGYAELDRLLFGGIPEKYAVVLTAPSSDERQLFVRRFLEEGANAGEITLDLTCERGSGQDLASKLQTNFYLVLCSLQADLLTQGLTNVSKLKGIDNLTEIDIALTKFFRTLDLQQNAPRRACIELLSDALLQHHAVITRKWLSGLLVNLKSKGFTTLAVIDPHMHPSEEMQAVLGLFDGEIRITEKEAEKGKRNVLQIVKLYNQRYMENETGLTKEQL